jgi:hypothetical protein
MTQLLCMAMELLSRLYLPLLRIALYSSAVVGPRRQASQLASDYLI